MAGQDSLLRPKRLDSFIGQRAVVKQLQTVVKAARLQRTPVGHLLFSGPAGTGKTSLAHIIANEMQVPVWTTVGTSLGTQLQDYDSLFGDKGLLRVMEKGGIVFVDECHQLTSQTQDVLLPWLEQSLLSIKYRAPQAGRGFRKGDWLAHTGRTEPHTIICASTMIGKLSDPFRDRFRLQLRLGYYDDESMFQIARRSAHLLKLDISGLALDTISKRSKAVPRILNNTLWYCQQWAIAHEQYIDRDRSRTILDELGIDELGLNETDRKLLKYLIRLDRPAGLTTICAYLSEDKSTVMSVIEPALIRAELLIRTPRGRIAGLRAKRHLRGA